ncbi:unnamed protein product, partial [Mesorhabditis spiculigera]
MKSSILALALLMAGASATITDLNCTSAGVYDKSAFNCENVQNDAFCTAVFGTTALTVGDNTDRPNACWKGTTDFDPNIQMGAVASCPKTCGYCCLSSAFTCTNKEFPRVNCKTVTDAQCKDVLWRQILADDCPARCGFCNDGGCIDAAIECANDKSICRNVDTIDFARANCKKTCGYCEGSSTTGVTGSTTRAYGCQDQNPMMCGKWQQNGFCQSSFYPDAQKRQYCARTCNMC